MICGVWSGVMVACGHTFLYLTRSAQRANLFSMEIAQLREFTEVKGLRCGCLNYRFIATMRFETGVGVTNNQRENS